MTYVALYLRISKDRSGRVEGVKAQERWGRAYAERQWPGVSVRVFADNDISATNGDHRPGYEALRQALDAGEVAHLWCVEQSRLERDEVKWFGLAAALDGAGIAELHTNRDGIVRVRDDVAGLKAVINAGEARRLRQRVLDKHAVIAAEGRPSGGVVFGYRPGLDERGGKTLIVHEDEAAVIVECAERVLDGWSLTALVRDLHERGIAGPMRPKVRDKAGNVVLDEHDQPVRRASRITTSSLRQLLTCPTVAGLRIHKGETVTGVWPAILDLDTWNAVRDRFAAVRVVRTSDGEREVNPVQRHTGRRYLLTGGTARCGVCDRPLTCTDTKMRSAHKPYYRCHVSQGGKGCTGILGEALESYVAERLLAEMDKPAFVEALAADEHAARRDEITTALRAIDGQRNDLAKMWARRDLTAGEWATARRELEADERNLRRDLAAIPPPMSRVDPVAIREDWDAMTLDERREIISIFVESVTVVRAKPGTRSFDPGRVAITWRTR